MIIIATYLSNSLHHSQRSSQIGSCRLINYRLGNRLLKPIKRGWKVSSGILRIKRPSNRINRYLIIKAMTMIVYRRSILSDSQNSHNGETVVLMAIALFQRAIDRIIRRVWRQGQTKMQAQAKRQWACLKVGRMTLSCRIIGQSRKQSQLISLSVLSLIPCTRLSWIKTFSSKLSKTLITLDHFHKPQTCCRHNRRRLTRLFKIRRLMFKNKRLRM
jgi:hypothetical protein